MAWNSQRDELFAGASSLNSRSGGGQRSADLELLERQNDELISQLHGKAGALKSIAQEMSSEVAEHNRLLAGMDTDMQGASNLLGETMGKLQDMVATAGGGHMCMLIAFVVAVFLVLYFTVLR